MDSIWNCPLVDIGGKLLAAVCLWPLCPLGAGYRCVPKRCMRTK